MNKTFLIIKREFLVRVKKKSFIIMTLLAPILMASLIIVPVLVTDSGQQKRLIGIYENTTSFAEEIEDSENINKRLGIKLKGFDYDRKFVFSEAGYNFEPSEIGASFGLVQLKKLNHFNKLRNKNFTKISRRERMTCTTTVREDNSFLW